MFILTEFYQGAYYQDWDNHNSVILCVYCNGNYL